MLRFSVLFLQPSYIGWWMVKSGLDTKVDPSSSKEIRVSPYRLATHLMMAFTTYVTLVWTGNPKCCILPNLSCLILIFAVLSGLDLFNTPSIAKEAASRFPDSMMNLAKNMRRMAFRNGALVAITVMSGAFVAGNDAGKAYSRYQNTHF
jgi:heme a synthase